MYILAVLGSGADADNGMAHLVTFIHSWEPFSNLGLAGDGGKQLFLDWLLASFQVAELEKEVDACVAAELASAADTGVVYSGPMPATTTSAATGDSGQQLGHQQQQQTSSLATADATQGSAGASMSSRSSSGARSLCTKYSEGRFDGKTCGVFQSFDGGCGFPNAPMEMRGKLRC